MPPEQPQHRSDEQRPDVPPSAAAGERPPRDVLVHLRPEHIYKAIGLLLLVLVLLDHFETLTRVLLVAYAAVVLSVAFNAVVQRLPGERRWVTALFGVVIFGLLGAGLWFGTPVIVDQIRGLSERAPEFQEQLSSWEQSLQEATGLNVDLIGRRASAMLEGAFAGDQGDQMLGRARGLLEFLVIPLLILFGALFAVGSPNERLLNPLLRAVPRERRPAFQRGFELLGTRLIGWILGTLLSMLIIGALSTLAFYLLGLNGAIALGVLNGVLEFVPLVGPWVGGAVAVIAAFLQDPQLALWTALVVLGIQQLESHLITPMVMSEAAEVHPFITLFAIVLFGSLFGLLGIFLAVPLVLLLWTALQVLWVERAIDTDEDPIEPVVEE